MTLTDDPHFEQIVNDLQEIQNEADTLLFYSVFTRLPEGVSEHQAPNKPAKALSRVDALTSIERNSRRAEELVNRLDEIKTNTDRFNDQIDDYLDDVEEAQKTLRTLKNIVQPELLNNNDTGKSEVSWLTFYKNALVSRIHKEHNQLEELSENEPTDKEEAVQRLKQMDRLIEKAGMLQDTARYLQWFTNRVVETNEALPEHKKDFTLGLVSGWILTEISKAKEHEQNCFNVKAELESKVFEEK